MDKTPEQADTEHKPRFEIFSFTLTYELQLFLSMLNFHATTLWSAKPHSLQYSPQYLIAYFVVGDTVIHTWSENKKSVTNKILHNGMIQNPPMGTKRRTDRRKDGQTDRKLPNEIEYSNPLPICFAVRVNECTLLFCIYQLSWVRLSPNQPHH